MIYFIQAGDAGQIKIGFTNGEPRARMVQLQVSSPVKLVLLGVMDGVRADERRAHKALDAHRIVGEWFRPHADVLGFIKEYAEVPEGGESSGIISLRLPRDLHQKLVALSTKERRSVNSQVVVAIETAVEDKANA